MTEIQKRLFELRDEKYAEFQLKLTPGITKESVVGVRVPILRKFAKELIKDPTHKSFLSELPHKYYDENMLHGLLVSEIKDYDACVAELESFLPYVDNWAVCDIMSPKALAKRKDELIVKIREWSKSERVYTCRFGLETLMTHFLDRDFKPEYLEIAANVKSDEYYVNMMIAWFFATALAKQWNAAIPYIENRKLSEWTRKKTISKSIESFRITKEQKEYLKTFR